MHDQNRGLRRPPSTSTLAIKQEPCRDSMASSSPFDPTKADLALPGLALGAGTLRAGTDAIATMCLALPAPGDQAVTELPHCTLARHGGDLWRQGDLIALLIGQAHWLDTKQPATAESVGLAYQRREIRLLDILGGQFLLLICDAGEGVVHAAVDRFAREPLYWYGDHNGIVLASTADALVAHPGVATTLSDQGLFNYLFFHMVPASDSVYGAVHKLPAAHRLSWRPGKLAVQSYWMPTFVEQSDSSDDLHAGVLANLGDAVARYRQGADSGCFLSGGLDSSTVAGLLARQAPGAHAYSIGFDAAGYDEIAYARIAVAQLGNTGHEYYVRPEDVLDALPTVAAAYDEPFGNSSALPALFCAAFAKQDGRTRLLAGDGGDELYAGNARYAKQKVFELFQRLPAVGQRTLHAITRLVPPDLPLFSKARSYVDQASVPLPDRLQTYNYLLRLGLDNMFNADFLAGLDTEQPLRLARDIYHRPSDASTLNRMLYLDWQHTLADNDLRKVGRMCALAGIEVRYPMLDEDVVGHSTQVPSALKLPGGKLRDFYKRAVADFLPQAIIDKPKQGFGLPFGVWMAEHPGLSEMAGDNLSRLRRRGILKPAFIDQALSLHQQEHAHYYGELVWVMMMLELWLTSRGFEP